MEWTFYAWKKKHSGLALNQVRELKQTTNEWGRYARELSKEKRLTGKIFTPHIERNNLTLGTRIKRLARRTSCFSRSVELHQKVIGAFIEKYMFN